jgi:hypothetical protein
LIQALQRDHPFFMAVKSELQAATPYREHLLLVQGFPADRHPVQQPGEKLPRFRLPRCRYRMVDFMSLAPSHLELKFGTL